MENLCPSYQSIFDELNGRKYKGQIKRLWSFNGTINFKFTDSIDEKPKKIFHECDLNYYFYEDIVKNNISGVL